MSSSKKPHPAASRSGDLPADALYEILLRIPAKELCRLRAVCPAWRALTSDPHFAAAHKSRHRTALPLLAMAYRDDDSGVNGVEISDFSGKVVRRIPVAEYDIAMFNWEDVFCGTFTMYASICVVRTRLDLVCFHWNEHSRTFWRVLNPVTGATIDLPKGHSEELEHELEVKRIMDSDCRHESCAFGQVSSSREYKALRISRIEDRKVCEVITFDGSNHGSWRRKQDPPSQISTRNKMRCAVVDGVVYYLMDNWSSYYETGVMTNEPCSVASFNLDAEEWMGVLRGPEQLQRFMQGNKGYGYSEFEQELALAELNGCLVVVHNNQYVSMGLWFLTDVEKGIWVKKYSLPSHVAMPYRYPFLMIDDGRIFISGRGGFLLSYDPVNDTYADPLKLRDPISTGIYTGSLLSL